MPASNTNTDTTDLRAEFNVLRNEVGQFMKKLKEYEKERVQQVKENVTNDAYQYQEAAKEKLQEAHARGEQAVQDVEGKIRDNPLTSLAIAFTVGYMASKISRNG